MHAFSYTNSTSSIEPGDLLQVPFPAGSTLPGLHRPQAAWVRPCGMYPFFLYLQLTLLVVPLGLHHPQAAWARPSGMYLPCIYFRLCIRPSCLIT